MTEAKMRYRVERQGRNSTWFWFGTYGLFASARGASEVALDAPHISAVRIVDRATGEVVQQWRKP